MITIELDLTNLVVASGSSAVSIFAAWYFSKRHYVRTPRPVTENDIALEDNRNGFRLLALISLLVFLAFIAMIVCTVEEAESHRPRESSTPLVAHTLQPVFQGANTASMVLNGPRSLRSRLSSYTSA